MLYLHPFHLPLLDPTLPTSPPPNHEHFIHFTRLHMAIHLGVGPGGNSLHPCLCVNWCDLCRSCAGKHTIEGGALICGKGSTT